MFTITRIVFCTFIYLILGQVEVANSQEILQLHRHDQTLVHATAYAPSVPSCLGVGIISPGAGGTEKGYRYLGETLSQLGFLALVVGHPESGRRALRAQVRSHGVRDGLAELIIEPDAYQGRFMDIAAAKRWAMDQCQAGVSVLIGHSMGAATVMMEAGASNKLGIQGTDSFSAYIALSPQGSGSIFPENAWSRIQKPVLMFTGTRDTELGGGSWESRIEPFRNMPAGCKWLGIIDGASHFNFAGNGNSRKTEVLVSLTIGNFLNTLFTNCNPPGPARQGMKLMTK